MAAYILRTPEVQLGLNHIQPCSVQIGPIRQECSDPTSINSQITVLSADK